MYRMSEAQRQVYLQLLLASQFNPACATEATEFREKCHQEWVAKGIVPNGGPNIPAKL